MSSLPIAALIDIRREDLAWHALTIPGSTPEVRIARLHRDDRGRAAVSVVRFPAGWSRPGTGHYTCAEEFVVVEGALTVSGVRFGAGEYGFLPAGAVRTASGSDTGCLAVAWFPAAPRWVAGSTAVPATATVRVPVAEAHRRRGDVPGDARGGHRLSGPAPVLTDIVWPHAGRWCLLPAGAVPAAGLPDGPMLVRRWA